MLMISIRIFHCEGSLNSLLGISYYKLRDILDCEFGR